MLTNRRIAALLLIAFFVVLWPSPASAASALENLVGGTKAVGVFFLDLGSDLLDLVNQLLARGISYLGGNLQSILQWPTTYGGATVYKMWSWIRDFCNMLFVVVLVAIAFGTIFDTIKSTGFHARQSLAMFIAAAILINTSLAVGQTIVWGGNQATTLVLGFLPEDVGAQLGSSLNVVAVTSGGIGGPTGIPAGDVPTESLTEAERNQLGGWITGAQRGVGAPTQALQYLDGCLKRNEPISKCFPEAQARALRITQQDAAIARDNALNNDFTSQVLSGRAFQGAFSNAFSYYLTGKFTTPGEPSENIGAALSKFTLQAVRAFLLLVLTLSFGAIFLFMMARIPAIWFLLALSAGAFFSLAVPTARNQFSLWLRNIVGFSFFGPLYLMVIYLGLFILNTQGQLISSGRGVNDLPFASDIFGTMFFYLIASGIFIGGAAAVTKFSFGLSPAAGTLFGRIGGLVGLNEKSGFGVSSVARGLGAITGVSTIGRGLQKGAQERFERTVTAPLAARQKRLEEGVRTLTAGGESRQKYLQSRIDERTKRLDTQLQKQTDALKIALEMAKAAEARADERARTEGSVSAIKASITAGKRRADAETALDKLAEKQETRLRAMLEEARTGRLGSSNETAIAAGNQLMKLQKITPEEMTELTDRYAKVSSVALQGFVEQRNKQLTKDAKDRKYADPQEMKSFLQLIGDSKEAGKVVEAGKSGKNKFNAIVAGAELQLITGADGKTPISVSEAVQREARRFNANDMLKAENYYQQQSGDEWWKQDEEHLKALRNRVYVLTRNSDSYAEMISNASADQLKRLTEIKEGAIEAVAKLDVDLRSLTEQMASARRAGAKPEDLIPMQRSADKMREERNAITRDEYRQGRREEAAASPPPEKKPEEPKKP